MNEFIQKSYYNNFYKTGSKQKTKNGDFFINQLLDSLDLNNKNILEIGCGDGYLTEIILEKENNSIITALDISGEAIKKMGKEFFKDIKENKLIIVCDDIVHFLKNEESKYDLIIGSGILHHINKNDWDNLFKSARDRLNPDGVIILSPEPNVNGFLSLSWRFASFFYNTIYKVNYDKNAEKGTFDMKTKEIIKSIKQSGFIHFEITPYKFLPQFNFRIIFFINKIINKILPYKFSTYITIKIFNN